MNLAFVTLTICIAGGTAWAVLKKYNPIFVFLFVGSLTLLSLALLTGRPILAKSLGSPFLDIFGFITQSFKSNLSGVGLIIMSVAGFAAYMKHINASAKLAFIANKPLGKIKNKYLVLSGTFVVGMALKIVISSYAGLLLLLLASIYPVLIAIGIRPITAASVLSLIALDYGPKDGNSIFMAETAGFDDVVQMFLAYQIYPVLCYTALIAILIPIYYSYVDKKDQSQNLAETTTQIQEIQNPDCPTFYILLPWLPVVLLFGAYFIPNVKLDVVSANFLSITLVFAIEFIRHKDAKKIADDTVVILRAMGDIFVSVVSIIIAASVFAEGIKALGGISILAEALSNMGESAIILSITLLSVIIYAATMIMGSGIAAFYAFGKLAPDIAHKLGIPPISLLLPMEIASCLGRAASPIAGGILALSGFTKVDPIALVKRTTPLLLVAMVMNILIAWYFATA